MQPPQTELMKDILESIFKNINEWLRFAEAKHSGLIAIGIGLLFIVGKLLHQPKNLWWRFVFLTPMILIGISVFVSLSSFSPVLENKKVTVKKSAKDNVYFFGSVAQMDSSQFKKLLLGDSTHQFNPLENQLIDQIIINSRITSSKMKSFRVSLVFFRIALFLLLLLYLSRYMLKRLDDKSFTIQ